MTAVVEVNGLTKRYRARDPLAVDGVSFALQPGQAMTLTVYLNNIVAAAIVVAFSFAQAQISTLHAGVVNNVITDHIIVPIINTFYWVVPHPLVSNLERAITIANYNINCSTGCAGMLPSPAAFLARELAHIPGASGNGDILYWLAYMLVICPILYIALRRKQV